MSSIPGLKNLLLAHLGHCTQCMRMSFVAAVTAWGLFLAAYAAAPSAIAVLTGLAAISLSAVWFAHIIVFATKRTLSALAPLEGGKRFAGVPSLPRREFVPIFLRTLAFAAVITASPRAITSAFGQNQGPCDHCERYKGTATCYTCCRCQNSNNVAGCKKYTDPDKYNTCIGNATATFGNCNKACQ
jgi:hypothetical protein